MSLSVRSSIVTGWVTVLWVALWGELSIANAVAGLLVGCGLLVVFPVARDQPSWRFRPLGAMRFVFVFLGELVKANAVVLRQVVTFRSDRFREAVIAYRTSEPLSEALLVVLGDAISLTPGTLTLDMDVASSTLYVHVLHVDDVGGVDGVRNGIAVLERAVVRGFA
jgi:multicomponent Na+:H+ antiporter subunit E